MISNEKLQQHGTMEEVEIEISNVDFKKIDSNDFSMKFDGKSLIFEEVFNREKFKKELEKADTIEELKLIIKKII